MRLDRQACLAVTLRREKPLSTVTPRCAALVWVGKQGSQPRCYARCRTWAAGAAAARAAAGGWVAAGARAPPTRKASPPGGPSCGCCCLLQWHGVEVGGGVGG